MSNTFKALGGQGIGKALLLWILLFSSLITLMLSGVQLLIDYRVEINTINARLHEIESSYKSSIEASLWDVDLEHLSIQLEGIKRLPDIQRVVVEEEKKDVKNFIYIEKGVSDGESINQQYELTYKAGGDVINIGTLYVEASLTSVYQRLINKAIAIMLVQAVKTFLVSFAILFLFYRLVTRHIITIEQFLKNVNLMDSFSELSLDRKPAVENDELDNLVGAYNSMVFDLRHAYDDIRTVNTQLKKDISARKNAETEVKSLNNELESRVLTRTSELEAANKELNSFCYSVSHDLRAPLRRVDGFRSNIAALYSDKLDQQGIHYLSRMEACTKEMNAMIDSFLILSKSTNTELLLEDVKLTDVVNRALYKLREREPERNVTVDIQKNVTDNCDARLVELLISNLIDNAWKYSSKNAEANIRFRRKKYGNEIVYTVEDNGAGFNMDFAENLFAPFTRLHKLSDFQGIGIGLATVKRVAVRHGGRVWAESSVGNGAKFFFTLTKAGDLNRNTTKIPQKK